MKKALVLGYGLSGQAAETRLRESGYDVSIANGYELVIASPGLPVRSELQLGIEHLRSRGINLLAVTGSKGKSSVVKVVADALNRAGKRALACGNYGLPVSAVGDCDWAVVEVSSFQLETTYLPPDTFVAAAVLNLQEDHLDRHGNVATYHALKRRLLDMAETAIDEKSVREEDAAIFADTYFDNPVLRANALAAVALMRAAGVSDVTAREAFRAFEPLPHRMNVVGTFSGVRYIDDSKATSLAALAAGVVMAGPKPVRLIAGGLPKGDEPKIVREHLTKHVKKVYLTGVCAEVFSAAWSDAVDCEICGTLERAVLSAMHDAEFGETILLSPGAASYDQFQNFGERGDVFADLVKKEGTKE